MTTQSIAKKGARNPFAQDDFEATRGTPGPLDRRLRPEGSPGLAAWFAGRMVKAPH